MIFSIIDLNSKLVVNRINAPNQAVADQVCPAGCKAVQGEDMPIGHSEIDNFATRKKWGDSIDRWRLEAWLEQENKTGVLNGLLNNGTLNAAQKAKLANRQKFQRNHTEFVVLAQGCGVTPEELIARAHAEVN